ncbi:MAG: ShlB/FhaC/HecB family hemolysin secretion/activation protein [Gallionella sp.]|nr:ShlB/FhaC/HecB family hemolysin secretion/activation protein [Gallionella sp.]
MSQFTKSKIAIILGMGVLAAPAYVNAAPQPDAGAILDTVREKDLPQPKKASPGIDVQREDVPVKQRAGGAKVTPKSFKITGSTAFSESELQALVAPWVGKEQSLSDLERAAAEISRHYRDRGYFVARAYLPAQDISAGVVQIAILEGHIGKVKVNVSGDGWLDEQVVQSLVSASAGEGTIVQDSQLERGLLLSNDLSGVKVSSTLVPGATVGTSDLVVDAEQTGAVDGNVDIDTFGNRFTGQIRVGGTLNVNSPLKMGDQLSARVMTTGSGMHYGRLSYTLPVGTAGTKVGGAYSAMRYTLGREFSALNATGDAQVASLYALHRFVRSRNFNLYGTVGYDQKKMQNDVGGITTSVIGDDIFSVGISGDSRDSLIGGGGMNSFSASYASGRVDLSGWPANQVFDAAGPQTAGSYNKFNYNIARMQRVDDGLALFASLTGQIASRNLESSSRFSLGGANGVRAYPQGEGSGDQGYLLNVEVRKDMGDAGYGNMQMVGFVDMGHIQLYKSSWAGWQGTNPALQGAYNLAGAGIGLNLDVAENYSFRSYLAAKIGSNGGRDVLGNDSDGTSSSVRAWLQLVKWF